jgi:hypothetical protein
MGGTGSTSSSSNMPTGIVEKDSREFLRTELLTPGIVQVSLRVKVIHPVEISAVGAAAMTIVAHTAEATNNPNTFLFLVLSQFLSSTLGPACSKSQFAALKICGRCDADQDQRQGCKQVRRHGAVDARADNSSGVVPGGAQRMHQKPLTEGLRLPN